MDQRSILVAPQVLALSGSSLRYGRVLGKSMLISTASHCTMACMVKGVLSVLEVSSGPTGLLLVYAIVFL